jgi:hypothetical protein
MSEIQHAEARDLFFRKKWTSIFMTPLGLYLYWSALWVSWQTLVLLVELGKESLALVIVIILTGIPLAIICVPAIISWSLPGYIGEVWKDNLSNSPWERVTKVFLLIMFALIFPPLLLVFFAWLAFSLA